MPLRLHYTGSCGHMDVVDRQHRLAEAPALVAYYAKHKLCSDCYKAQKNALKEAQIARDLEAATSPENTANLPNLIGSDKQIQWALSLRHKALQAFKDYNPKDVNMALARPILDSYIAEISVIDKATYWIDYHRSVMEDYQILSLIKARYKSQQEQNKAA